MADVQPDASGATPYRSLYRRFRPGTFSQVRGQDHVVATLRNGVREGRVAHAYLFSGPRGTGKTSTARILAKALNCADLRDGEPCGECPSCVDIARGTSLDVHELDAASNNGVDAMRDLVSHAALGTPGRQKVYIVDEVHMLSTAASNALLKTLEEPPGHVVFVLATTDPQKVLPTIRSRTQHFEFRLLPAETLASLLAEVRQAAQLDVSDEALSVAVRRGRGSARDTLSALDQLTAADEVDDDLPELDEIVEALIERDSGRALVAVGHLVAAGWGPQQLAGDLVEYLRQGFLSMVAPDLVSLAGSERDDAAALASRLGLAAVVRSMEVLGQAQVTMRDMPDPRISLEVALVRLAHPEADEAPEALLARIERLERSLGGGVHAGSSAHGGGATGPGSSPASSTRDVRSQEAAVGREPTSAAKPTLGALRRRAGGSEADAAGGAVGAVDMEADAGGGTEADGGGGVADAGGGVADAGGGVEAAQADSDKDVGDGPETEDQQPVSSGTGDAQRGALPGGEEGAHGPGPHREPLPSRDELVEAWADRVLPRLRPKPKALLVAGRFIAVEGGSAVFGLPNEIHRDRCEDVRADAEAVLAELFGRPVPLKLVVDDGANIGGGGPGSGQSGRTGTGGAAGPPSSRFRATGGSTAARGPDDGIGEGPGEPPEPDAGYVGDEVDLSEFEDAEPVGPEAAGTAESVVLQAFPGAEEVQ